ncbi:MAG: 16S rRNA (cytosine(1402)-N(4))-methyltransferase RsmH [Phycisphaeraceae bacterium]|nr:16S rRNA (cytosine(1402)-N(4))-methyltransferase RsmH [Phycisphaeraceae bacterium]
MHATGQDETGHIPVLLNEVLAFLDLDRDQPGRRVLDCTLGRGGHAAHIIPRLGPGGYYLGTDLDPGNLAYAKARLEPLAEQHGVSLHLANTSFAAAENALRQANLDSIDAVFADLGFASNQVDDPNRGLSFKHDGPLDMRLDPNGPATAADLVNRLGETELADILFRFGDERLSRRIARKIVQARADQPISTTQELAEICRRAYGPRGSSRIDPATRSFQALRIAVNGELEALDMLLRRLPNLVAEDGLVGIISFHSLEDRLVKRAFQEAEKQGTFKRVTRKPVAATPEEEHHNPRSRSAKLRVAKRQNRSEERQHYNPADPALTTGKPD